MTTVLLLYFYYNRYDVTELNRKELQPMIMTAALQTNHRDVRAATFGSQPQCNTEIILVFLGRSYNAVKTGRTISIGEAGIGEPN